MTRSSAHLKGLLFSCLLLAVFTVTLPLIPYFFVSPANNIANAAESPTQGENPRANFWRTVREGQAGYTAVPGREAGVYIHGNGVNWQAYRTQILAPYGSYLMGVVLALIGIFYVARGPVKLENGLSGISVSRFSVFQRIIHWFTAILFWLLALSGLVLLYGRYVLIPLLGAEGFAVTASACKEAHNLFGPIFFLALVLLFFAFVRNNFYEKGDISWLKNGGGMFGRHASAGRFNLGEKLWFWLVCLLGILVSVSGIVLDFSILGLDRTAMELAHGIHTAAALLFIAISFGHIYLGTVGTQGTLQGMTQGSVDLNWAKLHHDRWAEHAEREDQSASSAPDKNMNPAHG